MGRRHADCPRGTGVRTPTARSAEELRPSVPVRLEGEPWIAGEPAGDRLKIIGTKGNDLEIGFTLRPWTTDDRRAWSPAA
jgi:hypothetical protein